MTTFILDLTLITAIIDLCLANYIFYEHRNHIPFRTEVVLCLDLAVFSFSLYMLYATSNAASAGLWQRACISTILLLFPLSFQFTWMWTGHARWRFTPQIILTVYTLSGILILAGWLGFLTNTPRLNSLGMWTTPIVVSSPWHWMALAWIILVETAIIALGVIYILNHRVNSEPVSNLLIFSGYIFPGSLGFIFSLILNLTFPNFPYLFPVFILASNTLIIWGFLQDRQSLPDLPDITHLRQTEKQLQQTLSVLNATLESIPMAIFVADRQQAVVANNSNYLKLWQLPETWKQTSDPRERLAMMANRCRDPQAYFERINQLFNNLELTAVDLIETRDGRIIERTAVPYQVKNEIMGKVFTYQDITERQRIEEEERSAHAITEVLSSTGTAMSSSLDIEQVLDTMLVQLGRVVPYDTITILNIENGSAAPLRAMGYERFGVEAVEFIKGVTFKIDNTPNLKWMLETHQPLVIPEVQSYPGWKITPTSRYVHSWVGAPMFVHGQAVAFLSLNKVEPDFYTSEHARYLDIFANQAGLAMENARLFAEVKLLAVTDPLTGLSNRRSFLELAEAAFSHARRYERPLSVIMVDIDHFKQVNDRHGHFVGDYFLRNIGTIFLSRLRDADIKGRYGGEEFIFLLPETRLPNAVRMADRLRGQVANLQLKGENGAISITVSIGVTALPVNEDISLESLLIRADQAMYVAKEAGGNRLHVWEPVKS